MELNLSVVVLLSNTVACLGLGNKLLNDKVMLNAFGWELILLLHIRLAWVGLKLFSGALRTPPCESYSLFVLLPFCCPSEQLLMISNEGLLCQLQVTIGVHGHRSVSIAV